MENKSKPDMVFEFSSLLNKELLSPPSTPTTSETEEPQNDISPDNTSRPVSPEEYVIDIEEHMEKEKREGVKPATLSEETEVCAEPLTPPEPPKCLIMTQNVDLKNSDCYDVLTLFPKPSKWQSVLRYLRSTKDWESYKYLWIIDSNVAFTDDQISTFFKNISSIETGIFQPSVLVSTEHPSIHNYPALLHDQECSMALKPVKFIENKIPCFTTDIVKESLLPFLIQNEKFLHSGWGIDMWWATKHSKRLYVVNDVQVVNNIPPTLVDKKTGAKEMIHFIRKYKLSVNVLA